MRNTLVIVVLLLLLNTPLWANQGKSIIYRGEHGSSSSLPSLVIAALQRPDFIELPLLLTRDNVPVVYNDLFLHPQTNVADIFPERSRGDGNFYFIDFSLAEIEQLSYRKHQGELGAITTHPTSLEDALRLITHIGATFSAAPRILPVIKFPWFHTNEGKDLSSIVLDTLITHTGSADALIFLKCFDPDELQRIAKDLLPGLPLEIKLVQGIEAADGRETMRLQRGTWSSYNYDWLYTRLGLRVASAYTYALMLSDIDRMKEETLGQLIADGQGLKMKIFIDAPEGAENTPVSFYEKILFDFNADGLAVTNLTRLQGFLKERAAAGDSDQGSDSGKSKDGDASDILSDPEALGERLRQIQ
jgi:glycerophosphoryl diester phosphodiesterase